MQQCMKKASGKSIASIAACVTKRHTTAWNAELQQPIKRKYDMSCIMKALSWGMLDVILLNANYRKLQVLFTKTTAKYAMVAMAVGRWNQYKCSCWCFMSGFISTDEPECD
jgi:hypothetical protein